MPGGSTACSSPPKWRERRPGLKVLFTSGYSENALIHNDRIDSDILLLSKPYRRSDLARMIRRALNSGADSEAGRKPAATAREDAEEPTLRSTATPA